MYILGALYEHFAIFLIIYKLLLPRYKLVITTSMN